MTTIFTPTEERRAEPPENDRGPLGGVLAVLLALALAGVAISFYLDVAVDVYTDVHAPPVVTAPTGGQLGYMEQKILRRLDSPPATPAPDFEAWVRSIVVKAAELRARPDPAGLSRYLDPANPSYADAFAAQTRLAAGELRYDPVPAAPVVGAVTVRSSSPTEAVVDVAFWTTPRYRVVDRSGTVVSDSPAGGASVARWTLRLGDGTWRLAEAVSV